MRRLCSTAAGICPVTARSLQGMAPYPGQARCLALGFWPECFRRLNVKGGRRPFPEETRSALDIEGKHVTIQGPSPDPSVTTALHLPGASGIELMSYALRGCSRALLATSKPALASCSEVAAGSDRWLLMAVRGHIGDTLA